MKEIWKYICSDYYRHTGINCYMDAKCGQVLKLLFIAFTAKNPCFAYSFWLRLCQRKSVFYPIAKWMHFRLSHKYGVYISSETPIGFGLFIGHCNGIFINRSAVLGNNVNLSQIVTIGSNKGKAAYIGDNVYIGPSVCIVEDVRIGSNSTIGAGSVVIKDVVCDTTVAGVPAKKIKDKGHGEFIGNPWPDNLKVTGIKIGGNETQSCFIWVYTSNYRFSESVC